MKITSLNTFLFKSFLCSLGLLLAVCSVNDAYAQARPNLGSSARLFSYALEEMEKGDYEKANTYFRQIIENNLPLSPEMPYHFAVTLYELKQYDNSRNFLTRYLQINGRNAEKFEEAKELEAKLQEPLDAIKACSFCNRQGYRILACNTCEGEKELEQSCSLCKERGVVGCNRCFGKGLLTKRNVFNLIEYHECDQCNGEGKHTCPRCDGDLKEFTTCRTCQGEGTIASEEICDHKEKPRHLSSLFRQMQNSHD
ncbi:molecular chaperone DnaJ [Arthrospiribacter ruber]|uniref:Molecular chaperone DnaJ n=1 Tax=Arthrospiribacter ruber TaxID=2487934 RepID=A0A951IW86_9BACT|nr:molecular chaperone DnaJ [Arthrospiribacter ruber]MBW3468088.1 molecular chaperone DnaJ [Arthrospiribacter ruber]